MSDRAASFAELDAATVARWQRFGRSGTVHFPEYLGLTVEDVRAGYCRMRMPFRPELLHGGGIVHGGALATLLDAVLVPAIGSGLGPGAEFSTIDLHVQFLEAVADDDVVAEGWVVRQGRRIVVGESEARAATSGRLIAKSVLTYHVAGGHRADDRTTEERSA